VKLPKAPIYLEQCHQQDRRSTARITDIKTGYEYYKWLFFVGIMPGQHSERAQRNHRPYV